MSLPVPPVIFRNASRLLGVWVFWGSSSWSTSRRRFEWSMRRRRTPRGVTITTTELGRVPAECHTPSHPAEGRVLLYLHGGGYAVGSPRCYRPLVGRLANGLNAVTYVPDYRLAPKHRFPAAFDDALSAYQALLSAGWAPHQIFVAGDSAGGGLALALGVAAQRRGLPLPAAIGLISPAADFTDQAQAAMPRNRREPVLKPALMTRFADAYVDPADRFHHSASPLLADLTGQPPLVIEASGFDTLLGQARLLDQRAREAGVTVRYREHAKQPHGFQLAAGLMRQADRAIDDLAVALLEAGAEEAHAAGRPRDIA